MAKREKKKEQPEEEKKTDGTQDENTGAQQEPEIRHTINAEETFTLAKDVFDLRCFFMNIYKNRAVIARRLNIFSMIVSLIFTMFYAAYNIWKITEGVSLGQEIAVYILIGIYAVLIIAFVIVVCCSNKANTKTLKKYNKALKIFRFCIRIVSIAMAVACIVMSAGSESAASMALRIVMLVISIISLVFQAIPLIFGGISGLIRWAMSPSKGKARFSKVLLEWYGLVCEGGSQSASVNKVSKDLLEDIRTCIDNYIIPQLGKKKISKITSAMIYNTSECYPYDKNLVEGIFKNVFAYAEECGYVNVNPTKDLGFEGSIDEEVKPPRKTIKKRIAEWAGKKVKSIFNGFLSGGKNE